MKAEYATSAVCPMPGNSKLVTHSATWENTSDWLAAGPGPTKVRGASRSRSGNKLQSGNSQQASKESNQESLIRTITTRATLR